jgi:hypothetical protein
MANDTAHPSVGTLAEIYALEAGSITDIMVPEVVWQARVRAEDLAGAATTQRTTITIPSADFVTGRLTITIPRPGTSAVSVPTDASITDVEALIATTLAGVVTNVDVDGGDIIIDCIAGTSITAAFVPATQVTVEWGGTLVDGEYSVTVNSIEIPNNRAGGSPANVTGMADAFEASAEALIATTLDGVLQSADNVAGINTLIFEPGLDAQNTEVEAEVTANCILTFGGTPTDGTYLALAEHASLPGARLELETVRDSGSPSTNTDLADAFEAFAEPHPLLATLLVSANNTAGAVALVFYPGWTTSNLVITALSAPAPGTLDVTRPSVTITDATPAGPEIAVSHELYVDLNALQPNDAFPAYALRSENPILRVTEAFPSGTTATLDDGGSADTDVLDGVAVDATGWLGDTGSTLGDDAKTESAWAPRLTLALSDATPATGDLKVQVVFSPLPE